MFEIDWIKAKVRKGEYHFSRHGEQERQNDNLTLDKESVGNYYGVYSVTTQV
jgi:hypothetical protein